jgi:hypothetical protein
MSHLIRKRDQVRIANATGVAAGRNNCGNQCGNKGMPHRQYPPSLQAWRLQEAKHKECGIRGAGLAEYPTRKGGTIRHPISTETGP